VWFEAILESRTINLPDLEERVAEALLDPKRREDAHQTYFQMWKALEDAGINAFSQELLDNLPPTDKPN